MNGQLIYFLQGLKSLIYIDSTPFTDEREKLPWMSHWKRTLWSFRMDLGHFLRLGLTCASTRFYVKTSGLCVFQSHPTFFVLNSRKVKTPTPVTTNKLLTPCLSVASPQTSFGDRLSRIHFSPTGEKWMRDKRAPKEVCGEASTFSNAMKLEKLPVNDKITTSCQIKCYVSQTSYLSVVTNNKNELWKTV